MILYKTVQKLGKKHTKVTQAWLSVEKYQKDISKFISPSLK